MESTLKSLRGVLDVKAELMEGRLGEAEVFYDSDKVSLNDLKQAIPTASGERHKFAVIAVSEKDGG